MTTRSLADVPVAILAGGIATRLRPMTDTRPKALVEVAGKPFIEHQAALLRDRGFRRLVLCVGYLGEQIEAVMGDGSKFGVDVSYSYDGARLMGTAGALRRAAALLGEVFWVLYGDSYLDIDYEPVFHAFTTAGTQGLMTVLKNDDRWDRSNAEFRDGRLHRYDKRHQTPDMHHIDYGALILTADALGRVPADEPSDLSDLCSALVTEGKMSGYEVHRRFYEIGSPEGLAETAAHLAARVRPE